MRSHNQSKFICSLVRPFEKRIWSLYQFKECANLAKEFENATKIFKKFRVSAKPV